MIVLLLHTRVLCAIHDPRLLINQQMRRTTSYGDMCLNFSKQLHTPWCLQRLSGSL